MAGQISSFMGITANRNFLFYLKKAGAQFLAKRFQRSFRVLELTGSRSHATIMCSGSFQFQALFKRSTCQEPYQIHFRFSVVLYCELCRTFGFSWFTEAPYHCQTTEFWYGLCNRGTTYETDPLTVESLSC